jgi:adenosylcobinamide-phosphate synthase
MERIVLVLSALIFNVIAGGAKGPYALLGISQFHLLPAAWLRNAERKLNRSHRSERERAIRGMVVVAAVVAGCVAIGWGATWMLQGNLHFIEILLLAGLLPVRQTWNCAFALHKALKAGDMAAARGCLNPSLWRHYMLLDQHALARAGIETLAVHVSEKIVAPLCWYLLLGLPGILISKSLYLMVETLGSIAGDDNHGSAFMRPAQRVYFFLHYIPARLAMGLWMIIALFWSAPKPFAMARNSAVATPQSISLSAAAHTLSLSLGGPMSVFAKNRWFGVGNPKAAVSDLRAALLFFTLIHLFLFVLLGLFL